jgi:hypothetical protein
MTAVATRPCIAIDLDDTVVDTRRVVLDAAARLDLQQRNTDSFHPRDWFDMTGEQDRALFDGISTGLATAPAVSGAKAALEYLHPIARLVAVTGRSRDEHGEATQRWLTDNCPNLFADVVFADREGANLSKADICRDIGASVLIDELPEYVLSVAKAGIDVVYLHRSLRWQYPIDDTKVSTTTSWEQAARVAAALVG